MQAARPRASIPRPADQPDILSESLNPLGDDDPMDELKEEVELRANLGPRSLNSQG